MKGLINYGRHDVNDEDIASVVRVLKSDNLVQGPAVARFEEKLGQFLGASHVVACSNGTTALHLAYMAAGIGKGDAVIVPAITFAATANAVLYCGGTPIFADVDPKTAGLCPKSVDRCIKIAKKAGLKLKAIAPVHFAGRPCEMAPLVEISKSNGLILIEDACHAVGAEYRLSSDQKFQHVGASDFTSMTIFSFHPVKHITTGEGGAITTQNPDLAKQLRMLRTHGITKHPTEFVNKSRAFTDGGTNPWYMEMQALGSNYRLCDIQAALGESQVKRLPEFVSRRREIAKQYDAAFSDNPNVEAAAGDSANLKHSYHVYPIAINFSQIGQTRFSFFGALREMGIVPQVHYIPVCWHPYYEVNRNLWLSDNLDGASKFYECELSIPMYSSMTDDDVGRVIESIQKLTI